MGAKERRRKKSVTRVPMYQMPQRARQKKTALLTNVMQHGYRFLLNLDLIVFNIPFEHLRHVEATEAVVGLDVDCLIFNLVVEAFQRSIKKDWKREKKRDKVATHRALTFSSPGGGITTLE